MLTLILANLICLATSTQSMLCLFIKHVDKFCSLEVEVVDSAEQYRLLNMSNRRSTATIDGDEALLPLELEEGWNYLCLNLEDVVAAAFGSQYLTTTRVTINGSCSVARVYFQDRHYTVMDLPDCIRSALRA
jgi:TorA maturation chaperone TorD